VCIVCVLGACIAAIYAYINIDKCTIFILCAYRNMHECALCAHMSVCERILTLQYMHKYNQRKKARQEESAGETQRMVRVVKTLPPKRARTKYVHTCPRGVCMYVCMFECRHVCYLRGGICLTQKCTKTAYLHVYIYTHPPVAQIAHYELFPPFCGADSDSDSEISDLKSQIQTQTLKSQIQTCELGTCEVYAQVAACLINFNNTFVDVCA
jgi:hypothetical protein